MRKISNSKDTKDIALTIYNGGFGAVKETRKINLTGREKEVLFTDVAQKIETDSLLVEGLSIIEFNYDYDLVNREKLLGKYVDKEVFLKDRETGEKKSCRLLSVEEGGRAVLEDNESKEIYIDTSGEIVLPSLPSGLIVKPALIWKIEESKAEEVGVSYLTEGFNWSVNYVVEMLKETLNIAGWAEIENQSGMTFENARVKLIAGEVNRAEELQDMDYLRVYAPAPEPQAEEKEFFDYHMYTLNNLTTLKDNQNKQINILKGEGVPYKQYYKLNFHEEKADIIVAFENAKEGGLGIPMPKGKIKLYKTDEADNSLEFIGEDKIDHTSKNEEIELVMGKAFDIAFDYEETDREKKDGYEYYKYEYNIRNHKSEAAQIYFDHTIWGVWDMVYSTHEYSKKSSSLIEFMVEVPAGESVTVEFEYKINRRKEHIIRS
ncbi:DUF4139 domain-containing protein [Clostridium polynesiense]|uniref:DUF4139 domain-containing protein n=1 Tax=Clostridium polynesiense TaxID=1325933 RepID=UPI00058F9D5C|nr:hypothetical protein [Clostridium polynesiense]